MKRLLDLIHTGVRLGGVDSSSPAPASSISAILRHPPFGGLFLPGGRPIGEAEKRTTRGTESGRWCANRDDAVFTKSNVRECNRVQERCFRAFDDRGLRGSSPHVRGEGALQGKYIHRNNKPFAPFTLNPPPNSAACVSHLVPITQRSAPSSKN